MIGSLIVLVIIQFIINIYFYRELKTHEYGLCIHKDYMRKLGELLNSIHKTHDACMETLIEVFPDKIRWDKK